jgi:cytochrome c oxidase subunit 4
MTDMHTTADHAHDAAHDHAATDSHDAHEDTLLPTSRFLGIDLPVPLYTAVFGALAMLTIIEVILAELPEFFLTVPLLVFLSICKAILVVWYYMHLRTDNKLYALALLIPLFIGIVGTLFLLAVPLFSYPY